MKEKINSKMLMSYKYDRFERNEEQKFTNRQGYYIDKKKKKKILFSYNVEN